MSQVQAVSAGRSAGLLSKAVERACWSESKGVACPRPRAPPQVPEEPEAAPPRLSTSASAPSFGSVGRDEVPSDALSELRRLFAAECSLGTPGPGFGVSPPVRSGAANGLVHDSLWRAEAPRACKASLRALQERAGPLRATCAGDYRLLMASPDQGLLAGACCDDEDGSDGPAPGSCGGFSTGGISWMDTEGGPGGFVAAAAAGRSLASSRASAPSPGWYSGRPAHSPSPDPDRLLFSY